MHFHSRRAAPFISPVRTFSHARFGQSNGLPMPWEKDSGSTPSPTSSVGTASGRQCEHRTLASIVTVERRPGTCISCGAQHAIRIAVLGGSHDDAAPFLVQPRPAAECLSWSRVSFGTALLPPANTPSIKHNTLCRPALVPAWPLDRPVLAASEAAANQIALYMYSRARSWRARRGLRAKWACTGMKDALPRDQVPCTSTLSTLFTSPKFNSRGAAVLPVRMVVQVLFCQR